MAYVDGFLIPVPKKKLAQYRKMALWGRKLWMKHGAVQYFECVGDDLKKIPCGVPFPKLLKLKPDETAMFSFIIYKSRAHRDKVNALVMKDPSMQGPPPEMPFDVKKMAYGGFQAIVEA
jgi:alkaline phosphatase